MKTLLRFMNSLSSTGASDDQTLPFDINLLEKGKKIKTIDYSPIALLCIFLILPLNIAGILSWRELKRENAEHDVEISLIQIEQAPDAGEIKALKDKITVINGIITGRAFSWTGMLNALEPVVPSGLRLTGIRMSEGMGGVITAHARSMEDALEFVGNMNNSQAFEKPFIQSQRPLENGEYGLSISFKHVPEKER